MKDLDQEFAEMMSEDQYLRTELENADKHLRWAIYAVVMSWLICICIVIGAILW